MNKYIQSTIASHMKGKQQPSQHDLHCFVGMIETGEATIEDFTAAAGERVARLVESVYDAWSEFYDSATAEKGAGAGAGSGGGDLWRAFGPCLKELVAFWEKENG